MITSMIPDTAHFGGQQVTKELAVILNNDVAAISALYSQPYLYAHPVVVKVVQRQLKKLGYNVLINGELDDATAHGLRDTFGLEWELISWYDLIWHLYPHAGFGNFGGIDVGGSVALSAIAAGIAFFLFRGKI